MINWFNMPDEGLSNGGQFEIKELTATENKTYEKDGEVYNKVTVNVSGGGSSDFSTAVIDVTVNLDQIFYLSNAVAIFGDEEMLWVQGFGTMTYTLLLYKGTFEAVVKPPEGYSIVSVTGTGSVTVSDGLLGKKVVTITGDGTLTVELASD